MQQVMAMLDDDAIADAIFNRLDTHRTLSHRRTVRVLAASDGKLVADVHIDVSEVSYFSRWLGQENPGESFTMMTVPAGAQRPARFDGMDRAFTRSQADDFARWLRSQRRREHAEEGSGS